MHATIDLPDSLSSAASRSIVLGGCWAYTPCQTRMTFPVRIRLTRVRYDIVSSNCAVVAKPPLRANSSSGDTETIVDRTSRLGKVGTGLPVDKCNEETQNC